MNPTDTLTTLFSHNQWANLGLLEACAGLSAEQLNASLTGAFGSIHDSLQHTERSLFLAHQHRRALPLSAGVRGVTLWAQTANRQAASQNRSTKQ